MKKFISVSIIFILAGLATFLIGGTRVMDGCSKTGFPLVYSEYGTARLVDQSGRAFGQRCDYFNPLNFILDLLFWFVIIYLVWFLLRKIIFKKSK